MEDRDYQHIKLHVSFSPELETLIKEFLVHSISKAPLNSVILQSFCGVPTEITLKGCTIDPSLKEVIEESDKAATIENAKKASIEQQAVKNIKVTKEGEAGVKTPPTAQGVEDAYNKYLKIKGAIEEEKAKIIKEGEEAKAELDEEHKKALEPYDEEKEIIKAIRELPKDSNGGIISVICGMTTKTARTAIEEKRKEKGVVILTPEDIRQALEPYNKKYIEEKHLIEEDIKLKASLTREDVRQALKAYAEKYSREEAINIISKFSSSVATLEESQFAAVYDATQR